MKKIWLPAAIIAAALCGFYLSGNFPPHRGGNVPADAPAVDSVPADQEVAGQKPEIAAAGGTGAGDGSSVESGPEDEESGKSGEIPVIRGRVARGATMAGILAQASEAGSEDYVKAARRVFSLRSFRAGQPYVVVTDPATGRVSRFEYEIDDRRRLIVEGLDKPSARLEDIEYSVMLDNVSGVVDSNLFQAMADVGESPQLALKLVELFGSEINFIKDLREGDSFRVLVEKRHRNGQAAGYGRILAATFTNRGKTYEAFLFGARNGKPQYYNRRGENLHKTLLQAPLSVTRVTSRFSQNRFHPILGRGRPHLGVDYGAPTGTPVKAVGDGVVSKRGWAGGYGHQIVIRHNSSLESLYAHLSGYARGLREGKRVRQGEVIGYVGSTGLSTGPHLDFRLRQNGSFINPARAINPRSEPVPAKSRKAFENSVAASLAYLDGRRNLSDYRPDRHVDETHEQAPDMAVPVKGAVKDAPGLKAAGKKVGGAKTRTSGAKNAKARGNVKRKSRARQP